MPGKKPMTNWQSDYVQSNGIRIHYHRTGGNKPVLILIHGFTDNGLCWSRTACELQIDFDIIMPDARGHGLSEKPVHAYSKQDHTADVAGLIEQLDLGPVFVLGHSVGANTAATLAADYPHLVKAVLLEDPPWRDESDPLNIQTAQQMSVMTSQWRKQIEIQQRQSAQQIESTGRERCPSWHSDEFAPWAKAKQQVSSDVVRAITPGSGDWLELAAKFQCPVLLITGDTDKQAITSDIVVRQTCTINSSITHVHLAGAGHNIHREKFEEFLYVVRDFLSQLRATID